jgi:hypothetical protein
MALRFKDRKQFNNKKEILNEILYLQNYLDVFNKESSYTEFRKFFKTIVKLTNKEMEDNERVDDFSPYYLEKEKLRTLEALDKEENFYELKADRDEVEEK